MPVPVLKKFAEKTGKRIEEIETLWDAAKREATRLGIEKKMYWGFVVNQVKRDLNIRESLTFKEFAEVVELPIEAPVAEDPVQPVPGAFVLVNNLFWARDEAHKLHLATGSYAEHKALEEFYDSLLDLTDELAEAAQGKYGLDSGFTPTCIGPYAGSVSFIQLLASWFDSQGKNLISPDDGFLKNLADEVQALIYRTKYKLENLK